MGLHPKPASAAYSISRLSLSRTINLTGIRNLQKLDTPAPPKRPARNRKTSDYLPDLSTMSSEELARKKQEADVIASLAKSKKAELDLSERRGELVDRATLAAAVFGYLGKLNRILLESVDSEIELYFDRSESMTKQDLVKIRKELLTKHLTESATAIKSELRRGIIRAHKMAADDDD